MIRWWWRRVTTVTRFKTSKTQRDKNRNASTKSDETFLHRRTFTVQALSFIYQNAELLQWKKNRSLRTDPTDQQPLAAFSFKFWHFANIFTTVFNQTASKQKGGKARARERVQQRFCDTARNKGRKWPVKHGFKITQNNKNNNFMFSKYLKS